ncbi:hypothetical protein NUW54_g2179 [Trametes sanguinea]|uniref:Uncharacterized protein n=1 Tax=Trametes sanguinea TaxID=158606 RepID=A0ACC1Q5M6_9APHY|nr:hypothetical protein NUW54_g2179 [Trametes sanguinea]
MMMGVDQSNSRFPRSAPADPADPRGMQQQFRPSPPLSDRPSTAAPHPLSREIATEGVPRIASPVPPALRGRVSPFPTAPVLPREQTTPLMRRTSKLTKDAVVRATRALQSNGPASSNWMHSGSRAPHPLSTPGGPPVSVAPQGSDDEQSFLAYDDDDDLSGSSPNTRPASAEPPEPSPDVNAILAGFRAERDAQRNGLKPDMMRESHTLSAIVAGYAEGDRDTMYLDSEEGGGDRYSVWSDAASHHSFLDGERSAAIRAKFVKRVEAMYGKDTVPPVPYLDPGLKGNSSPHACFQPSCAVPRWTGGPGWVLVRPSAPSALLADLGHVLPRSQGTFRELVVSCSELTDSTVRLEEGMLRLSQVDNEHREPGLRLNSLERRTARRRRHSVSPQPALNSVSRSSDLLDDRSLALRN